MAITKDTPLHIDASRVELDPLAVKAGSVIYAGGLACVETATGLGVDATDAAGLEFAGIGWTGADPGGADGVYARLHSRGVAQVVASRLAVSCKVTGATPTSRANAFIVDNDTVSASATTHSVKCGTFISPDPLAPSRWIVRLTPIQ
ncbi:MAG: hypothetical protein AAGN46_08225 [Acidobacteriota bacterium]